MEGEQSRLETGHMSRELQDAGCTDADRWQRSARSAESNPEGNQGLRCDQHVCGHAFADLT